MSVRMTNCGALGWVTDKSQGYRYQPHHPVTGKPWPAIPQRLLELWHDFSGYAHSAGGLPRQFLFRDARMGLHQDRDEQDLNAPVLSISLGDACLFRVGGTRREERTISFRLESGDHRRAWRAKAGLPSTASTGSIRATSTLLKNGGRINLTLRRVTRPAA